MTLDRSQIFAAAAVIPPDPTVAVPAVPAAGTPPPAVESAPAATNAEKIAIQLDAAPARIAKLVVTQQGPDHYGIEGFHDKEPLPRMVAPRSSKDIVGLQTSEGMRTYLHLLRDVQATAVDGTLPVRPFQQLALWIKRLRELHGDDLALVIEEHTATGIPWEMVRVQKSHLGAVATTVRWKHIVDVDDETRRIEDAPSSLTGCLVSCPGAAPAAAPGLSAGQLKLFGDHLAAVARLARESCASLVEWRQHLRGSRTDIGLIYVLCHGIWSDPQSAQLKSIVGNDAVKFGELVEDGEAVRAVVFLNACASGVVAAVTEYLPERQLVGFADAFLQRGAAAVIGTISQVLLSHAADFALRLIQAARAEPEKPLAVLFRDLRRASVTRFIEARVEQDIVAARDAWFYTFHYVLWGSPTICLELS